MKKLTLAIVLTAFVSICFAVSQANHISKTNADSEVKVEKQVPAGP